MNTPNVDTIEYMLKMIDFLESSSIEYMDKMQAFHLFMCGIATSTDWETYKYCSILSRNYTQAQLTIALKALETQSKGSN